MLDGSPLNVPLDDYTAAKIEAQARASGISPGELAAIALRNAFFDYDDFTWINGDPREIEPSPSDGEGARDWEEVRPEFLALIDKTFPRE